ncbi:MAG: hypothetical protein MHM6MM_002672 [Cercozoa sp. M6MM]
MFFREQHFRELALEVKLHKIEQLALEKTRQKKQPDVRQAASARGQTDETRQTQTQAKSYSARAVTVPRRHLEEEPESPARLKTQYSFTNLLRSLEHSEDATEFETRLKEEPEASWTMLKPPSLDLASLRGADISSASFPPKLPSLRAAQWVRRRDGSNFEAGTGATRQAHRKTLLGAIYMALQQRGHEASGFFGGFSARYESEESSSLTPKSASATTASIRIKTAKRFPRSSRSRSLSTTGSGKQCSSRSTRKQQQQHASVSDLESIDEGALADVELCSGRPVLESGIHTSSSTTTGCCDSPFPPVSQRLRHTATLAHDKLKLLRTGNRRRLKLRQNKARHLRRERRSPEESHNTADSAANVTGTGNGEPLTLLISAPFRLPSRKYYD